MASVTLQGVSKWFGGVAAVDNVSLTIVDQEFLVLVGPSGSGKTTLLRLIAGLEPADGGDIYIGDRWVNGLPAKDRDIAMVFQSYALYPHMNVFDNMAFGLKLRHTPRAEMERRVQEVAGFLEIEHLLKRKPKELSGGERQRAALGRAIVREPKVFLMDEPLSNLDAKLRVQTRAELVKLHRRLHTTVVYVTHDQVEAMTMGDRIAVMSAGRIHQVDAPQQIYDYPANTLVGSFIGSPGMNFFSAAVASHDNTVTLQTTIFSLDLPREVSLGVGDIADRRVLVGVRPEDLIAAPQDGQTPGSFQAQVEMVERLGSEKLLHLIAGETPLVARVEPHFPAHPGDALTFALNIHRLHFFDPATGAVLRSHG